MNAELRLPRWLSDDLAFCKFDVRWFLGSKENMELGLNIREIDQQSYETIVDSVSACLRSGLLQIEGDEFDLHIPPDERFPPPPSLPEQVFFIGFTARGGEAWERQARPDWNRYFDCGFELDENGRLLLFTEAQSDELAWKVFEELTGDGQLDLSPAQRKVRMPWNAQYWKVLPNSVRFEALVLSGDILNDDFSLPGIRWEGWWHWIDNPDPTKLGHVDQLSPCRVAVSNHRAVQ